MIVVDASVALKWVVTEERTPEALALRALNDAFAAPSLVVEEMGNALWKRAARGDRTHDNAVAAFTTATRLIRLLVPAEDLATDALRLAIQLHHPIYDCFYLALAIREKAPLVTDDRKLAALAGRAGAIAKSL